MWHVCGISHYETVNSSTIHRLQIQNVVYSANLNLIVQHFLTHFDFFKPLTINLFYHLVQPLSEVNECLHEYMHM